MKRLLLFLLPSLWIACSSTDEPVNLNNVDIQNIISLQDTKDTKGLIPYFLSDNANIRARACLAFASIKDSTALSSLYTMLEEDEKTASAAAYAIGQTGIHSSVEVLQKVLNDRSMNEATRYAFFVALGKCADINDNYFLVSHYNVGKDARATAWALFYMARNKTLNQAGYDLCMTILENEADAQVRLGAAQAIMRCNLEKDWNKTRTLFLNEKDENVKMALAAAMQGIENSTIDEAFINSWTSSSDNVKVNAYKSFDSSSVNIFPEAMRIIKSNTNIDLQIATADFLIAAYPNPEDFLSLDLSSMNWRVRATLLKPLVNKGDIEAVQMALAYYNTSDNFYEKGWILQDLGQRQENKAWLIEEINGHDSIISTYGMMAYDAIISAYKKEDKLDEKSQLMGFLESENDAVITYAAFLLRDSVFMDERIKEQVRDRINRLDLPRQLEAGMELENTLAFLNGESEMKSTTAFNHPIVLDSLAYLERITYFKIETTKGEILMEVEAFKAPGTVQSIARLIVQGYYDGKLFHRVVPNFVIQAGCPYGDGWGGLNFSMRSEFSDLEYGTGTVGMASAGQDTESCQWFITHSPTPHLNGRYTIFAQVVEGMDVVQNIEVGDRIIKMEVVLNPDSRDKVNS